MSIEVVEGQRATISFDGHRCIHARRCVMGEPHVFGPMSRGRGSIADAADPEALMRVAHNCPSGAIHVTRKDGGANEHPPEANIVIVRENGPLAFHADLRINGQEVGFRATLCRCGLSRNKPYLRQRPHQWRLRRDRRAAVEGKHACDHRSHRSGRGEAGAERPADGDRQARGRVRHRPQCRPRREGLVLPLRPFFEEAVLRRHPQGDRLRGAVAPRSVSYSSGTS